MKLIFDQLKKLGDRKNGFDFNCGQKKRGDLM